MRKNISHLLIIVLGLLFSVTTLATNTINVSNVEVAAGETCTIEIAVSNTDQFTAFQTDILLPDGFSYVASSITLVAERINGHEVNAGIVNNNTLRIIVFSANNTPFIGNSGTLLSFSLIANNIPGTNSLTPINAYLGDSNMQNILTAYQSGSVTVLCPDISVSSSALNYCRVALTQSGSQNVTLSNIGNQNLIISELLFSDIQFSSPDSEGFIIEPGNSRMITITFEPTQKGIFNEQMQIISNDPDEENVMVTISAIAYTINELHCGNMTGASGSFHSLDFSINNMEDFYAFQFDLVVPSVLQFIENDITIFRDSDHQAQASMINSQVLRVVVFSATGAFFEGNDGKIISLGFNINGNAGYYPLNLQNVVISNVEVENITSDIYHGYLVVSSPDIHANTTLNFGDVSVLEIGEQNLTVYNYGQEPLVIHDLTFNNPVFASNDDLPITIQPNNIHNLTIKFNKQIKGSAAGVLRIFSNDPDENPYVVNLAGNAYMPNYIVTEPLSLVQGDLFEISVKINNKEEFVAFQFDFDYPEGLTPEIESTILSNRKADHQLSISAISNNRLRLIAWSATLTSFSGEEGAVVMMNFKADSSMVVGTYPIDISNAILSNTDYEDILYGIDNGTITVNRLNKAPVASAGPDQVVEEGTVVILDGSGSNDPDGDAISYLWSAPDGITLSDATAQKPSFTAPEVVSHTPYEFVLVVSDGELVSLPDTVVITVRDVGATIDNILTINNVLLSDGEVDCFNALENIVISGDGPVVFESGSFATIIAGQSIRFLPGFHAKAGSSVNAWITTSGDFCPPAVGGSPVVQAMPIIEKSIEKEEIVLGDSYTEKKTIRVYPNPNNGQFIIDLSNFDEASSISIYNAIGIIVFVDNVNNKSKHEVNMPFLNRGVYFVKVVNNNKQYIQKFIVS